MLQMRTQGKRMKRGASLFLALCMIVGMLPPVPVRAEGESSSADKVEVTDYAGLKQYAEGKTGPSTIIVKRSFPVPVGTVGDGTEDKGTCQIIVERNLVIMGEDADSAATLTRTASSGAANTNTAKSVFGVKEATLTIRNLTIDGGAVWSDSFTTVTYLEDGQEKPLEGQTRFKDEEIAKDALNYNRGVSGRSIIDVFDGGTLNLDNGAVLQNGRSTNNTTTRQETGGAKFNFGGAVRVDEIKRGESTLNGTVNMKSGAVVRDCLAVDNKQGLSLGGAFGLFDYGVLNIYGGTISRCGAGRGAALPASPETTTASTICTAAQ